MINKECFTTEWIAQKSTELQYNDKNLIEKVIRAFSLLEMLSASATYMSGWACSDLCTYPIF